jgi:lysophospholipase L1-like esterase
MDFSEPKRPKFSAAAVHVTARLRGRPTAVLLEDEIKYGTTRGYYDVFVDGAPILRVSPQKNVTRYPLPNISAGEHTLVVVKRTEALVGSGRFLGLELEGELLNPPAAPARKLEFIGDSITAGSGNEAANGSSQCNEDGWGQPYENGYLAYGPVVARSLGADYHVTAVSGIGLVRNYSSRYDARTMPDVYDLTFTEDSASPRWDASRYVPDAVVVALGTNDWSPGDTPRPTMKVDDFAAAYVRFIRKLRGYYPNASFFAVSSPMLGDGYPNPTDTAASDQRAAISKAVSELNASGDRRVFKFFVTKQNGEGCGTHPSAAQQAATARELGDYMRATLGW